MNQEVLDKLEANAERKITFLFYRPPGLLKDKPYPFSYAVHVTDNKLWLQINNLSNWGYEWYKHEVNLPAKYFK